MMRGNFKAAGMVLLLATSAANGAVPRKSPPASASATPLPQNCAAHSFETTIQLTGADGALKQSKVHLCGTAGQSDA